MSNQFKIMSCLKSKQPINSLPIPPKKGRAKGEKIINYWEVAWVTWRKARV